MKVHFIHLPVIGGKGGTTVAYHWINAESGQTVDHGGDAVAYALANCNPKEVYCKRMGRLIAEGRLHTPERGNTYNCGVAGTNATRAILEDLGYPSEVI